MRHRSVRSHLLTGSEVPAAPPCPASGLRLRLRSPHTSGHTGTRRAARVCPGVRSRGEALGQECGKHASFFSPVLGVA